MTLLTFACALIGTCTSLARPVHIFRHCAVELYNNLLWANWSRAGLRHLIILGNSFSDYDDNSIGGELARKAPYVDVALATVTETAIPNTFSPEAAFNNMSVHSFQDTELTAVPAA